jgi:hypothetical protein
MSEILSTPFPLRRRSMAVLLLPLIAVLAVACSAATPAALDSYDEDSGARGPTADEPGVPVAEAPSAEQVLPDGALIVHTGQLRLEVTDTAAAVDAANGVIAGVGGYVAGSQAENSGTRQSATITYRIPAARWQEALAGLRGLAERVVAESTAAAEVTAQVVDLDARIANLRASEAALQEIMSRAGSIKDVLEVQRELSSVRGQIEQLTAQRDNLAQQAAYGTLATTFELPVVAVTAAQEGWDVATEIDRALADLVLVGQRVATFGIWLAVVVLPILLPFLVLAVIAHRLRRRWLRGGPASQIGPSV